MLGQKCVCNQVADLQVGMCVGHERIRVNSVQFWTLSKMHAIESVVCLKTPRILLMNPHDPHQL